MAAKEHALGTIHHFVRFRGEAAALYLGTAEVTPLVDGEPMLLEVKNDLAGRQLGIQDVDDGERHTVSTVINRFDFTTWKRVSDRYYHLGTVASRGLDDKNKRGSLIRGIGDFQLILLYDFTAVAPTHPLATAEQPVGRLYYSANPVVWKEDPSATRVMAIPVSFRCESIYDPSTRSFGLYTEDPAKFGNLGTIT